MNGLTILMDPTFRLEHQPLGPLEPMPDKEEMLGGCDVATQLKDRLAHSDGGSFLLTGLRGTGKTTALRMALSGWRKAAAEGEGDQIVAVHLVLARATTEQELLFEIIRRLVEELTRQGLISKLSQESRDALLIAYARTSFSQKKSHSRSDERESEISLGGSLGIGKGVELPLPKSKIRGRTAETQATELSFLTYSRADAEHDFLKILNLLSNRQTVRVGRRQRFLHWFTATKPEQIQLRVVIALDEVDKFTRDKKGQKAFQNLLSAMKNAFSTSRVHIVIVAGIDQHDRWLAEGGTDDSLYRSIFAWHAYQPCIWDGAKKLVTDNIEAHQSEDNIEIVTNYLEFRGRGVVRTLLAEFNELVTWHDGKPLIALVGVTERRVRFISKVQAAMSTPLEKLRGAPLLASPATNDRWRSEAYLAVDWTLRTDGQLFAIPEIVGGLEAEWPTDGDRNREERLETLLASLAESKILEVVDHETIDQDQSGDKPPFRHYRLSTEVLDQLRAIADSDPRGRAEILNAPTVDGIKNALLDEAQRQTGENYRVRSSLGGGAVSAVYLAQDKPGRTVVIKVARGDNAKPLEDEASILEGLSHDGVVSIVGRLPRGFVMDAVPGESLDQIVDALEAPEVIDIGLQLIEIASYLSEQGLLHLDIKPSNIVLKPSGQVVLVDFGSAMRRDELHRRFTGTPSWAAPEWKNEGNADERSEMFSIALVMSSLLGIQAHKAQKPEGKVLDDSTVPSELRKALVKALDSYPGVRFQTFDEMSQRLTALVKPEDGYPERRVRSEF